MGKDFKDGGHDRRHSRAQPSSFRRKPESSGVNYDANDLERWE